MQPNVVKSSSASVDQSIDVAGISNEAANLDQEDTVIDESNSGEPWVQGLVEGEYSDLSVEERLSALVALVGIANEGNSIRVVLEVLCCLLLIWWLEILVFSSSSFVSL